MPCSRRLIVQTLVFSRFYLHRQVSPLETPVVKGGTTSARNGLWILPENARLPCNIQGSFTCRKYTTWDKRLYFHSEGRRCEDFFALKSPTASAEFEPANFGTKGQHATSRSPKPLGRGKWRVYREFMYCGTWRRIVWWVLSDVSKDFRAFAFKGEGVVLLEMLDG